MSTTFGIKVPQLNETIEIAHRHGVGKGKVQIDILNPLIYLLKEELTVIAMDNTSQGINNIGDILNHKDLRLNFQ